MTRGRKGAPLACDRLLRGEDGPAGHEIVRLEGPNAD